MTYNQEMILALQYRITAMDKYIQDKDKQFNELQERFDALEKERQLLVQQIVESQYP
jgi:peptidoglycan hydrolase CwlO-like protein